jgi:hypothetical protein
MVNPTPENSGEEVSVTKSKAESAMKHRRQRGILRDPVFSEQEFNALCSADAHLGAAQAGVGEAVKLISSGLKVSD